MDKISSRKYDFYYEGNNGAAILLIHGITGTPSEMRYLGKKLNAAGFTVVCNTLPRHCESLGELKRVTWQEITDACLKDFQELKSKYNKVFVGGLSMGALMAVHIAHKFPAEVSGIIALAPTLFYDGWALHKGKVLMNFVWHVPFIRNAIQIREGWPYGLKDETLRANFERFYKDAKVSEFDKNVLLFGSPFFPMACLYQHHLFTKVVMNEFASVRNPIVIIHAREDDMASIKNARYVLENIGSDNKLLVELEDSYHMVTIDKEKDRVAGEAIKFLNGI